MTLTIYAQKVLISRETGPFLVDKLQIHRVSRPKQYAGDRAERR